MERFKVKDLACGYGFTIFAVNEKHGQLMGTGVNKDGQIRMNLNALMIGKLFSLIQTLFVIDSLLLDLRKGSI